MFDTLYIIALLDRNCSKLLETEYLKVLFDINIFYIKIIIIVTIIVVFVLIINIVTVTIVIISLSLFDVAVDTTNNDDVLFSVS